MHNLWIDGRSLKEFGIYVSGEKTFNSPEQDYESVSVPGRNGDLIYQQKRFKNIVVPYPSFIRNNFAQNAELARNFLLSSQATYRRLEDDYHPETYRKGFFAGPMDFDTKFLNLSGNVELLFNCKPQRFLKSGDYPIEIKSGQILYNSYQDSLPIIRITGNGAGTLTIGDVTITVLSMSESLTFDCEISDAYKGTSNENNNIQLSTTDPIKLQSGETKISFSGGIKGVSVIPRWWTL